MRAVTRLAPVPDGLLVGDYSYQDGEGIDKGTLRSGTTETTITRRGFPLARFLRRGVLAVALCAPGYRSFEGLWGSEGSRADHPWNGALCIEGTAI